MSYAADAGEAGGEAAGTLTLKGEVNPFYTAMYKFQLRRWDECIDLCTELLRRNPQDQAVRVYLCLLEVHAMMASYTKLF